MRARSPRLASLALLVAAVATPACRKRAPEAPPPPSPDLPTEIVVKKDAKLVFTFVQPDGSFASTDDAAKVPESGRRVVRVIDPARPAGASGEAGQVYVIDLSALEKGEEAKARLLAREAFETSALAQLPPGDSSPFAPGQAPPGAPAAAPAPSQAEPAAPPLPPGTLPVVTLYGTSWCGACKTARAYFIQKGIPFADKDVEKDPAAARELAEKAQRLGVAADRVPVLDVRGRLLLGFDRARVEALLGEAT